MTSLPILYQAEPAEGLLIEPLDAITLVYHRRSGVTHMVAEPVPEILAVMRADVLDACGVLARLGEQFDLDAGEEALASVAARLNELAELGLIHRVTANA